MSSGTDAGVRACRRLVVRELAQASAAAHRQEYPLPGTRRFNNQADRMAQPVFAASDCRAAAQDRILHHTQAGHGESTEQADKKGFVLDISAKNRRPAALLEATLRRLQLAASQRALARSI